MGQKAHQRPQQIVKSHCMVQKTTMENIIFTHSFINLCRTNVFHTLVFCRLSWTSLWDLPPPTHSLRFLSNSSPYLLLLAVKRGLPGWLSGTEPTCQCQRQKRLGFDPWVRKTPWMSFCTNTSLHKSQDCRIMVPFQHVVRYFAEHLWIC